MDIAITGSTGLIGSALSDDLRADGHTVIPVVRRAGVPGSVQWDPASGTIDAGGLDGIDAVVHLAGEGIASGPWTAKQRERIHQSRKQGTKLLADTLAGLQRPPATLVSGSAIGWYGDRGDEVLVEGSTPGSDFLAQVCLDWEQATSPAAEAGLRVVHLRTGIVVDAHGGALAKQLLPFRLGLGARAGKGTQWMSWITLHDEIRAIRFALDHDAVAGPVNLTAPNPVTNRAFTEAVAQTLHRPAFLAIPRFVSHLPGGVGPLIASLLFSSARVQPTVLDAAGFTFDHPELDVALASVLGKS